MTPLSEQKIREIEKRLNAATPGPWIQGGCSGRMITTPDGYKGDGFLADVDTKENSALIANAPEDIRLLLAEVKALREQLSGNSGKFVAVSGWKERVGHALGILCAEIQNYDGDTEQPWKDLMAILDEVVTLPEPVNEAGERVVTRPHEKYFNWIVVEIGDGYFIQIRESDIMAIAAALVEAGREGKETKQC